MPLMNGRLAYLRERLETSVWVLPLGLCLLSAALAVAMLWLDRHTAASGRELLGTAMPVAAARQVLGVIAASIIGVGGVAFSLTMVALTLTSGQYGPRIIRHFLEDTGSKLSLGLFLGVYVYALVVTTGYTSSDVARYSVLGAVVLAFLALVGFVGFIHRTATDLQADRIIERIGTQLSTALGRMADPQAFDGREHDTLAWRRAARGQPATALRSRHHGYVQVIDHAALAAWCDSHDCRIAVRVRAGDFVVEGSDVMKVYGTPGSDVEALEAALVPFIVTGPMRTPVQDPEYAITQLVQLAARALSPGINDPGTAITCVDWFSLALSHIVDRELPGSVHPDSTGTPRLLARSSDFPGIMKAGYAQMRQFACGDVSVSVSLLESLARLARLTRRPRRLRVLREHAELLWQDVHRCALPAYDEQDVRRRYRRVLALTAALNDDNAALRD